MFADVGVGAGVGVGVCGVAGGGVGADFRRGRWCHVVSLEGSFGVGAFPAVVAGPIAKMAARAG